MYSIAETIEDGVLLVTVSPSIRIKENILYWPPAGSSKDRSDLTPPEPNWKPHMCRILKENIGTFEEALELEKLYSKHRDSNSFRENQERKNMKRQSPVNYTDPSNSFELIDVREMINKIDGHAAGDGKIGKYHENCMAGSSVEPNTGMVKKHVAKNKVSSNTPKTETRKGKAKLIEKRSNSQLPFQNNYLKKRVLKAKDRKGPTSLNPKLPRYDNFLKSAKRTENKFATVNKTTGAPSSTITKEVYEKEVGKSNDMDVEDADKEAYPSRTSTPIEKQGMLPNGANYAGGGNTSRCSFDRSYNGNALLNNDSDNEFNNENFEINSTNLNAPSKVNVVENVLIRPATIPSHESVSFEEKILAELINIRKHQESFEARMEKRIETFINDQTRKQATDQSQTQGNSKFRMPNKKNQRPIQGESRQYSPVRNQNPTRYREFTPSVRNVDDFEEYDELDKQFPVNVFENAEELEYNMRQDLDFKFLLLDRLNELGADGYKKCIRLKMKYLFTDPVLEGYTWHGTAKKSSFKALIMINRIILRSVRDQFPGCKYFQYKNYMQQWLKHARSRQRKVKYTYPAKTNRVKKSRGEIISEGDDDDDEDDDDDGDEI